MIRFSSSERVKRIVIWGGWGTAKSCKEGLREYIRMTPIVAIFFPHEQGLSGAIYHEKSLLDVDFLRPGGSCLLRKRKTFSLAQNRGCLLVCLCVCLPVALVVIAPSCHFPRAPEVCSVYYNKQRLADCSSSFSCRCFKKGIRDALAKCPRCGQGHSNQPVSQG